MPFFDREKYKIQSCYQRYFDLISADMRLSPRSIQKYREIVGRLINEIGNIDVRKIDKEIISKLKSQLNAKNLSSSTKNQVLVTIRNLAKFLSEEEGLNIIDSSQIKKFKEESKPVDYLSDEEVKILLDSIGEESITKLRLKTLIICLLSTGARISEIISLNKDDINFETGIANVIGKGAKINQVIFNEISREYLRKYINKRQDSCPALFATSQTNSPKRWQVNCSERAMRNQGRNAGLKKRVYPHLMRKTAASKMFFSGAPLSVVSKFLSHSDLATTQKYYLRGANFEEVKHYHKALNFGIKVQSKE